MSTSSPCPRVEDLKEFRLGLLSEPCARQVEQHLPSCPSCVQRLSAVPLDDPLVRGLRAQRNQPRLSNLLLLQVQQEMRSLRRAPAGASPVDATVASQTPPEDRTVAAAAPPARAETA